MNKACLNCGRIITVPDIPLPDGYTQKCTACGYSNPVNDEFTSPTVPVPNPRVAARQPSPAGPVWDTDIDRSGSGSFGPVQSMVSSSVPEPFAGDQTIKRMDAMGEALTRKFEARYREMEAGFKAQIQQLEEKIAGLSAVSAPAAALPAAVAKEETAYLTGAYQREIHEHVAENEILIASQHPSLFRACEPEFAKDGYQIHAAKTAQLALKMIQSTSYQILILDQNLLNSGDDGKRVLKQVSLTGLVVRRCQCVVLVSPGITTGESQLFYQWGIDLNVHPKDLEQLPALLRDLILIKHKIFDAYLAGITD